MKIAQNYHQVISQIHASQRASDQTYLDKMSNMTTQQKHIEKIQTDKRILKARLNDENLGQNVDTKA